jgi:L-fuculose-phosphate aldolase
VSFKEMTVTDPSGRIIFGKNKPSSEISFHLAIYKKDKKCNAIIHTHPPFVMALYTAGLKIAPYFMAESKMLFEDKIIEIPFIMPGSKELADEISANANKGDIFILQNHGIVVKGHSLEEAFILTEALEHNARIKMLTLLCAEKKGMENIISCAL